MVLNLIIFKKMKAINFNTVFVLVHNFKTFFSYELQESDLYYDKLIQ